MESTAVSSQSVEIAETSQVNEFGSQELTMLTKDDAEVPVLSVSEVIDKLRERFGGCSKQPYPAMYSSIFGGITTDPMMMVIPIDDHMVHRGHGVFDTAMIIDGYIYELDSHLDRFLRSASKAKIIPPVNRSSLRSILLQTVTASQCRKGSLRYWLSAGPGDFLLSPAGCPSAAFYAIVIEHDYSPSSQGVTVITSSTPMKSPEMATVKSVNYLPNALSKMEAEEKGASAAIWIDDQDCIAEGPNVNVAFISKNNELLLPSFDKILSGCTVKRLLALAPNLVEQGLLKDIRVGNITLDEGKGSAEMMLVGSGLPILPVTVWDGKPIGNGKEGPVTLALSNLLWEDMIAGPASLRIPIRYGKAN